MAARLCRHFCLREPRPTRSSSVMRWLRWLRGGSSSAEGESSVSAGGGGVPASIPPAEGRGIGCGQSPRPAGRPAPRSGLAGGSAAGAPPCPSPFVPLLPGAWTVAGRSVPVRPPTGATKSASDARPKPCIAAVLSPPADLPPNKSNCPSSCLRCVAYRHPILPPHQPLFYAKCRCQVKGTAPLNSSVVGCSQRWHLRMGLPPAPVSSANFGFRTHGASATTSPSRSCGPTKTGGELEDRQQWLLVGTLAKPFTLKIP